MAAMLVGTCTKIMPLRKVEATNPPKSPTTPPPKATIAWRLSALRSASQA